MSQNIKVVELFAGVGGFRLGLEKSNYDVVWSNQYEPSTKRQHASEVYESHFGTDNHSREDINLVDINDIPDHDLLVGGFPCFKKGTMITTSRGLTPIEDIKTGDMVLTHTNTFQKVVMPMKQKKVGIYKLKVMGSPYNYVTEEHPYYVRERSTKWNKFNKRNEFVWTEPKWIDVKDLNPQLHYIGFSENKLSENIYDLTMEDVWLLGRYVADVNIIDNLKDDRIKELCGLCNIGMVPSFILDLPIPLLKEFIEGYLYKDNSDNMLFNITSKNEKIIYSFGQAIQKVYKNNYSITLNKKGMWTLTFYKDNRRTQGYYIDEMLWMPIRKIEYDESFDDYVYNFEVENDNSYVANNCTVHNCQDYSVASTSNNSKGIEGKKGVLWWSIYNILNKKKNKPPYLLLENVDRLLKSPSKQRGRDFAIMLNTLNSLGYAVEWRVINAAEYGMPQRRRRIFILGYHKSTEMYDRMNNSKSWLQKDGVLANSFPIKELEDIDTFQLSDDLIEISDSFNKGGKISPFFNTGIMIDGKVHTSKTVCDYGGEYITLKDILFNGNIPSEFYIDKKDEKKWEYLKGAKSIERTTKDGFIYNYTEGGMIYPDNINNASRTIITGEGGKAPSRFKHVINDNNRLRRLLPIELERLNMFPDNHTQLNDLSDTKRAFFMGNALVIGVIEKIGKQLYKQINTP